MTKLRLQFVSSFVLIRWFRSEEEIQFSENEMNHYQAKVSFFFGANNYFISTKKIQFLNNQKTVSKYEI